MPGSPAAAGAGGRWRRSDADRRDGGRGGQRQEKTPYLERVVTINRVAKVVKGGRRFSFTALVVVGDGDGTVGVGYGKAKEVPAAIAKGVEEAKKNFFKVPRIARTIPHPVQGEKAAGVVLLKPGQPRYRRHRRWPGARRARVRRHPRRAVQVARLGQPDQHRARDRGRAEGARPVPRRSRPAAACRSRTSRRPACCARAPVRGPDAMAELKITQTKSGIGYKQNQRETLRTLGLKRMHDVVVKEDRPEIRGMIHTVPHLVTVEEVD